MMTGPDRRGTAALPPGYRIEMLASGATTSVRITGETGELAASGYATEAGGVFLYDRIVTEIDHRRRGLGSAVMSALAGVRQSAASVPVLVATEDGRALYTQLGWTLHTPFSTACIPPE
jgi:predicted GNAT family acetyltransferase